MKNEKLPFLINGNTAKCRDCRFFEPLPVPIEMPYHFDGRCLIANGGHYLTNGGAAPCSENERPDEWAQIGLEG